MVVGLGGQWRLLRAELKREIDVTLGATPISFLGGIGEAVFMLAFVCAWHYMISLRPPYGNDVVLFFATGTYPFFAFVRISTSSRASLAFSSWKTSYPVEKPLELLISTVAVRAITYLIGGVGVFGIIYLWRTPQAYPWNTSDILAALSALMLLGFGLGSCSAVIETIVPWWRWVWAIAVRLTFLLSGIMFVPDHMPLYVRDILVWNPVLHGVTMFRMGFYPQFPSFVFAPAYLWVLSFASAVLGLIVLRLFRRRLIA